MNVINETGVFQESVIYFLTPSELVKKLFFYVTCCGHYYCDTNYSFGSQYETAKVASHINFLLFYVVSGSLNLETDGKKYSVEKKQIALIDCKKPHYYKSKEDTEFLWVHIDGANTVDFFDHILSIKNGKHVFSVSEENDIYRLILKIISRCGNGRSILETVHSQLIYKILCNLLFTPIHESDNWKAESYIGKAIQYIDHHLVNELTLEMVSKSVNMSMSNFSRKFKIETGYAPHEYITLRRISRAKYVLKTSDLSIKEIAFQVGYNSETNFIRSFIAKVGISPNGFRKNPF